MNINFKLSNQQVIYILIIILLLSLLFSCNNSSVVEGYGSAYADGDAADGDAADAGTDVTDRVAAPAATDPATDADGDAAAYREAAAAYRAVAAAYREAAAAAQAAAADDGSNTGTDLVAAAADRATAAADRVTAAATAAADAAARVAAGAGQQANGNGLLPTLRLGAANLFGGFNRPRSSNPPPVIIDTRNRNQQQNLNPTFLPDGNEFIRRSKIVPPVCPACPPVIVDKNTLNQKCPPCPPCARCPEPSFECQKVPNFSGGPQNNYLPRPVLSDFSMFGM